MATTANSRHDKTVELPKAVLTITGSVLCVLLTGFIGWMAALESRLSTTQSQTARVEERTESQRQAVEELKAAVLRIGDRVEALPRIIAADIERQFMKSRQD